MDTFYEQLIPLKKSAATYAAILGIWVLAIALSVFLVIFYILGSLSVLAAFGILFAAYKLTAKFSVEYEYIITNGTVDIDKITNKSSRKRVLTFELSSVTRLEKFNPAFLNNIDKKLLTVACEINDPDAYFVAVEKEGKGTFYLVFAPEERMKEAIIKFVPKYIGLNTFKD